MCLPVLGVGCAFAWPASRGATGTAAIACAAWLLRLLETSCANGSVRGWMSAGALVRVLAASPAPSPPPCPATAVQRQAVRVRSCGDGATPSPSAPPSVMPAAGPPPPLEPPSASDMPAGPLELPSKSCRDYDSEDEDSSGDECDVAPYYKVVPHIIQKRLSNAAYNEIGVDWCKGISYKAWPDAVKALCIYRIEAERLRMGGTRFKVGIAHRPRWRFIDAPYAYALSLIHI